MKVALVHDHLTEYGGAERVLEAIHEIWPSAPVYTSICDDSLILHSVREFDEKGKWDIRGFKGYKGFKGLTKTFTFFMPLVFENFDLREYEVVISDGTIWSKSVLTTPEQLHIFYCHTPPRWLYGYPGETDRRRLGYLQPILKPLDNWLRVWDFESAQRPDFIIANSQTTAARVKKFWRREAEVIYPPVELGTAASALATSQVGKAVVATKYTCEVSGGDNYFLVVSRLSAYKNVDLAIEVCDQLKLPLVVVGTGREEERLKAMAGPTVRFLKHLKDSELAKVYQNCRALIHPASDEDFGIAPVEAMSFGKPVIALRRGGVTETVIEGKTGVFFDEPTVVSLIKTIQQFSHLTIRSEECIAQAQKFFKGRFQREFREFVEEKWRVKIAKNA